MSAGNGRPGRPGGKRAGLAALAALVVGVLPAHAYAHGQLSSSDPPSGARLSAPPREVRLQFTEAPELALSRIEVKGPEGAVPVGRVDRAPGARDTLVAPFEGATAPGTYTVEWRTAGRDGHPVRGRFEFTVLGAAPATSGEAAPAPIEEPESSAPQRSAPPRRVVWVAALAVAGAAVALATRRRRHRRSAL